MDRRSWPWRKKSSEKAAPVTDQVSGPSIGTEDQDLKPTISYMQITQERYAQLSELEDQVKVLNERLSASKAEIIGKEDLIKSKEDLVKQHTKVAEEAVSGWEKAEAEALALKNNLESVTLLKLTAEERAAHLDSALKECMKQIRNVKEESEQKLQDVVFAKTKKWEKIKFELEAKINAFEQELLRSSAENEAISRSLQERSNMLMKVREEKAQAEAEIEVLQTNIQSCERDINTLKYEVHIVSKELEIRNEEKNMCARSAEVANKQHLEDVKKITKLETECQRLRGLVRKKLPGPAALAQMKLEVENLGRDYGESRLKRSPAKSHGQHFVPSPDFAFENLQQYQKENEFLAARLLATEEETKMLKEALSKRNSELQASRNMFAKTASKLRTLEAQVLALNHQRNPSKANLEIPIEGTLSQSESNPPSLTSMSEDGVDDEASCSESWATALISELSSFKKEKDTEKSSKAGSSNHLELMDDFLEMERMACLPGEPDAVTDLDGITDKTKVETSNMISPFDATKDAKFQTSGQSNSDTPTVSNGEQHVTEVLFERNEAILTLHSAISLIFESQGEGTDICKILVGIKNLIKDTEEDMPQHSTSVVDEAQMINSSCDRTHSLEGEKDAERPVMMEDMKNAITQIHDMMLSFGKSPNAHGLGEKVEEFSSGVNKVLSRELHTDEFIVILSNFLSITKKFGFRPCDNMEDEEGTNNSDCIDKVTLLENKVVQCESQKGHTSSSSSVHEMLKGRPDSDFELKETSVRYSSEDFEQLKVEKDCLSVELARCTEILEQTNSKLLGTEKQLSDVQLQLSTCQESKSLAETQLKCMVESYRSLESRTQELEMEINLLQAKAEMLNNELRQEKNDHKDCLVKFKDLQEQMERNGKCSPEADTEVKTKHETEITAAAEKLAECQETILILGRQLKALRPQTEFMSPSRNENFHITDDFAELSSSGSNQPQWRNSHFDRADMANDITPFPRTGDESPFDGYGHFSPIDADVSLTPMSPLNLSIKPRSRSSTSSNSVEEKHGRGFSRFFSKGKSNQ